MASALLSNAFPTGRPPPDDPIEECHASGEVVSLNHIIRLNSSVHASTSGRLSNAPSSEIPGAISHLASPSSHLSDRELHTPAMDIIRIFRHARPGVNLNPSNNTPTTPRPQLVSPILLPSHLRSIAAFSNCFNNNRPHLRVTIQTSTPDPVKYSLVPFMGHAAPAA